MLIDVLVPRWEQECCGKPLGIEENLTLVLTRLEDAPAGAERPLVSGSWHDAERTDRDLDQVTGSIRGVEAVSWAEYQDEADGRWHPDLTEAPLHRERLDRLPTDRDLRALEGERLLVTLDVPEYVRL